MLFFALFVQVDKCNAKNYNAWLLFEFLFLFLHSQIETDTGSAGEQPVRDIFD
jgi:hypothetical protein